MSQILRIMIDSEILLSNLIKEADGIYSYNFRNETQLDEIKMRDDVAHKHYDNYLEEVHHFHSIPVMDAEADLFISQLPDKAAILDVGGCWGWHWRNLDKFNKQLTIVIVDLVRHNLYHAQQVLDPLIRSGKVILVHGDATNLPFADNTFDGYWSVQTIQHIPDFEAVISEAYRIVKPAGKFVNYSLNNSYLMRKIYSLLGKTYHLDGKIEGKYFLRRASNAQKDRIAKIFGNTVRIRFSEIVFQLEFKTVFSGREKSLLGKIDSFLSGGAGIRGLLARQISFHTEKK